MTVSAQYCRITIMDDAVLTLRELSIYLKIPESSLYKIVREGIVPAKKIGKHWRFSKNAIDQWIKNGVKTISE